MACFSRPQSLGQSHVFQLHVKFRSAAPRDSRFNHLHTRRGREQVKWAMVISRAEDPGSGRAGEQAEKAVVEQKSHNCTPLLRYAMQIKPPPRTPDRHLGSISGPIFHSGR